jgi:hypothetical protein
MLNLDTHILLYALTDDLSRREASLLSNDAWSISPIVLWEIGNFPSWGAFHNAIYYYQLNP